MFKLKSIKTHKTMLDIFKVKSRLRLEKCDLNGAKSGQKGEKCTKNPQRTLGY